MDSLTSAIKNQLSFNKMLESQLAQLAAAVPLTCEGKIPRQPQEPETTNLVDVCTGYYIEGILEGWKDESIPPKRGDPGRLVIPISIGQHDFSEVLYNLLLLSTSCQR